MEVVTYEMLEKIDDKLRDKCVEKAYESECASCMYERDCHINCNHEECGAFIYQIASAYAEKIGGVVNSEIEEDYCKRNEPFPLAV